MDALTAEKKQQTLDDYHAKCREHFKALAGWQDFWHDAIVNDIEIPHNAHSDVYNRYVNIAQYSDTIDEETRTFPLDVEATQKMFARIIKWARKNGWTITKKHADDEFTIVLKDIPAPIGSVEFYSTRQVVCKRVVTGTKIIPAKEVEEYEYQCDKVAFLKVEV